MPASFNEFQTSVSGRRMMDTDQLAQQDAERHGRQALRWLASLGPAGADDPYEAMCDDGFIHHHAHRTSNESTGGH